MKASIQTYNAFLKEAKRQYGLTHKQAQTYYRKMSARLHHPAHALDLRKHPRIARGQLTKRQRAGIPKGRKIRKEKPPKPVKPVAELEKIVERELEELPYDDDEEVVIVEDSP